MGQGCGRKDQHISPSFNGALVVTKMVLHRSDTGTVTSEVVTGERFDLCDRLCRFHVELFVPFKNIDSWREWKAIFQNRPKNVRLAYLSMNCMFPYTVKL